MSKRKPSDAVQLSVRAKESLRAALEEAADGNNVSMNAEVVRRLERSFERDRELGDDRTRPLATMIANVLQLVQQSGAPKWLEDPQEFDYAIAAVVAAMRSVRPRGPDATGDSSDVLMWHHVISKVNGETLALPILQEIIASPHADADFGALAPRLREYTERLLENRKQVKARIKRGAK